MKANTLMSPRRTGGQRWVRQCSRHVYRLDLLLRQQQNAFDPIVIIIELSYRIVYRNNFDLSYRLSIGNSIWHIVTALLVVIDVCLLKTNDVNVMDLCQWLYDVTFCCWQPLHIELHDAQSRTYGSKAQVGIIGRVLPGFVTWIHKDSVRR